MSKVICQECGTMLEVESTAVGTLIECGKCLKKFKLCAPRQPGESARNPAQVHIPSASQPVDHEALDAEQLETVVDYVYWAGFAASVVALIVIIYLCNAGTEVYGSGNSGPAAMKGAVGWTWFGVIVIGNVFWWLATTAVELLCRILGALNAWR